LGARNVAVPGRMPVDAPKRWDHTCDLCMRYLTSAAPGCAEVEARELCSAPHVLMQKALPWWFWSSPEELACVPLGLKQVFDPGSRCFCAAAWSSGGSFVPAIEFTQECLLTSGKYLGLLLSLSLFLNMCVYTI